MKNQLRNHTLQVREAHYTYIFYTPASELGCRVDLSQNLRQIRILLMVQTSRGKLPSHKVTISIDIR